jgi:hypothetical protein
MARGERSVFKWVRLVMPVSVALFAGGYALAAEAPLGGDTTSRRDTVGQVVGPSKPSSASKKIVASRVMAMSASRASGQEVHYTDPSGDNPGNSPDITSVTVSTNDAATAYTFRIEMPNYSGLTSDVFIDIYIDSDRDGRANYLIRLYGSENRIEIDAWNGSGWSPFVASFLQGTSAFPEVIDVGRSDIGGTGSFWFWTRGWKYIANSSPACCYDNAPDAGAWEYRLSTGTTTATTTTATTTTATTTATPGGTSGSATTTSRRPPLPPRPGAAPSGPPPPGVTRSGGNAGVPTGPVNPANPSGSAPAPRTTPSAPKSDVKLVVESFTLSPKRPRVGRVTARLRIIRDDTGSRIPDGVVSCRAVLGKRHLQSLLQKFVRDVAMCQWRLPRARSKAALSGQMRVTYGGSTVKKSFRVTSR